MTRAALALALVAALTATAARAFLAAPGVPFPLDPFTLTPLAPGIAGWNQFQFYTLAAPFTNAAGSVVVIVAGEGNAGTMNGSKYGSPNFAHLLNLNVYDGATYQGANDPWLGATAGCFDFTVPEGCSTGGWIGQLGDAVLAVCTCTDVYFVPVAVYSSKVSDWATGALAEQIPVAIRRLAARTTATPVTIYLIWGQGESDHGTSQVDYQAAFTTMRANAVAALPAGWTLVTLVAKQTWNSGSVDATVQAAQLALVDGVTVFAGPNADARNATYRGAGNTYWTGSGVGSGAYTYAQDWAAALHALGAPL